MGTIQTLGYGFAWNTSALVIGKIITFANLFIILTHLTVYEYGLTELTFSVVSTVSLFMLPGLVSTITADLAVERGKGNFGAMKALFLEFFLFSLAVGILAWGILFFGSSFVAHLTGNDLIDRFFKIVAFLFLVAPWRIATTMLATVMVRYADQSFFSVVEEGAKGLFLCVFFFALGRGADGLLFAAVCAQLTAVLLFLPRTLSAYRTFSYATGVVMQPLWMLLREHRKWSVASSYMGTLVQNVRLWLIKVLLGTEAVGMFAFAFGILGHLGSVLPVTALITPLVPSFVDKRIELVRLVRASIKLQLAIALTLSLTVVLLGNVLVEYFFPKYLATLPLIDVILISFIISSVASPLTPVFTAFREQKTLFLSHTVKMVIMLVTLPIMTYFFGLVGVGLELALTVLGNAIERFYRFKKILPEFTFGPRDLISLDGHERHVIRTIFQGIKSHAARVTNF